MRSHIEKPASKSVARASASARSFMASIAIRHPLSGLLQQTLTKRFPGWGEAAAFVLQVVEMRLQAAIARALASSTVAPKTIGPTP